MPNCSAAHERCCTSRGSAVVMACLPPRGWSDTSRGEQGPWHLSPAGPSLSWSVVAGASDLRDSATGPLALVMFHGPNRRHPKRHPPEYSSGAVGVPNVTLGSGTSPSLVNGLLVSRRRLGRQGRRCEAPAPKVTRRARLVPRLTIRPSL